MPFWRSFPTMTKSLEPMVARANASGSGPLSSERSSYFYVEPSFILKVVESKVAECCSIMLPLSKTRAPVSAFQIEKLRVPINNIENVIVVGHAQNFSMKINQKLDQPFVPIALRISAFKSPTKSLFGSNPVWTFTTFPSIPMMTVAGMPSKPYCFTISPA